MGKSLLLGVVAALLLLVGCDAEQRIAVPTHDPQIPKIIRATDRQTGVVEVQIPGDWYGLESGHGSITIANSGAALRRYQSGIEKIESGMIVGTVRPVLMTAFPEESISEDLSAASRYIMGQISAPQSDIHYTFGSPQVINLDDSEMVIYDGLGNTGDLVLEVRLIIRRAEGAYGIIFFASVFGELETHFEDLKGIGQTFYFIRFDDIVATQSARTNDNP